MQNVKEVKKAPEKIVDTVVISCFICDKPSAQRWAIDSDYIVCPYCGRLYKIEEYENIYDSGSCH